MSACKIATLFLVMNPCAAPEATCQLTEDLLAQHSQRAPPGP